MLLAAGFELGGGWGDCEEAVLLVADRLVPLVVGAAEEVGGALRLVVELFWVLVELLLVLRVEPTSLRKREFMDVDDIYERDIIAPAWQPSDKQQQQQVRQVQVRERQTKATPAAIGGPRAKVSDGAGARVGGQWQLLRRG